MTEGRPARGGLQSFTGLEDREAALRGGARTRAGIPRRRAAPAWAAWGSSPSGRAERRKAAPKEAAFGPGRRRVLLELRRPGRHQPFTEMTPASIGAE